MIIVCISHADAEKKAPRRLTNSGRDQTKQALQRAHVLVNTLRSGKPLTSMRLISSPACRCLETILMAGDEFGDDFASLKPCPHEMEQVEVRPELFNGDRRIDLLEITQGIAADLVVVSLHGDLAKVPPLNRQQLKTIDKDGFFDARPVIAVLQRRSDELDVVCVEGFYEAQWLNLKNET